MTRTQEYKDTESVSTKDGLICIWISSGPELLIQLICPYMGIRDLHISGESTVLDERALEFHVLPFCMSQAPACCRYLTQSWDVSAVRAFTSYIG